MNSVIKALRRIDAAAKGLVMTFTGRASSGFAALLTGTRYDYRKAVGDGSDNSAVTACINWIVTTFPEAPLRVQRVATDGTKAPVVGHAMVELINAPNPYYDGELLIAATVADFNISGNAYWLKIRSGAGRPVELWWVPSSLIEPKWPEDGSAYLSHYEYKPGNRPIRIEPEDVIHFRFRLDPKNPRKGISRLHATLREVFADDEAANFAGALLRNMGVPGVVISPDGDTQVDADTAEAIKVDFAARFGGDNRGMPGVFGAPMKVQVLSFSPEQMNLRELRRLPEERISAALGVPAIVAGLGAGLDRSIYNNFSEAREAVYEQNIIPTQRIFASALRRQLLPDFGDTRGLIVDHDYSEVRVLQEDRNALTERAARMLTGGIVTVHEARHLLGLTAGPEHAFWLLPQNVRPVASLDQPDEMRELQRENLRSLLESRRQLIGQREEAEPAKAHSNGRVEVA